MPLGRAVLKKYFRSLSKSSTIPQTVYLNSVSAASTSSEKAALFNTYFNSVFTCSPFELPQLSKLPDTSPSICGINISPDDVL